MASKRRKARRQYAPETKQQVVADAREVGVCAAARKHGISESNVSRWLSRASSKTRRRKASAPEAARAKDALSRASSKTRQRKASAPTAARAKDAAKAPAVAPKRRVAKSYTPSQVAEAMEYVAEHGVTAAARKLGMSRFTLYDWQSKVQKAAAGKGSSPAAGPAPSEVEEQRDREILAEWKRHPGLGPSQVRNQLRRTGVKVSTRTVRRVMEEAGYRPPKVKRQPHDERFEAVRPNHLWHLDFVHRHINRASTFTLILLDDCSRYVVGHGVDDAERADFVIDVFEQAVRRHGRPEMVIHDKGSAFWSWRGISRFTALLTELGIDQIVAEHKEWNGKLEVFNANIQKELFDVHRFYDLAEMRRRLAAHLSWYNEARTSHALGGLLVPADRYYGRSEEVLARIEAGAGRDLGDGLALRDRTLELFKVISKDGAPEIWLMGRRILDLRD